MITLSLRRWYARFRVLAQFLILTTIMMIGTIVIQRMTNTSIIENQSKLIYTIVDQQHYEELDYLSENHSVVVTTDEAILYSKVTSSRLDDFQNFNLKYRLLDNTIQRSKDGYWIRHQQGDKGIIQHFSTRYFSEINRAFNKIRLFMLLTISLGFLIQDIWNTRRLGRVLNRYAFILRQIGKTGKAKATTLIDETRDTYVVTNQLNEVVEYYKNDIGPELHAMRMSGAQLNILLDQINLGVVLIDNHRNIVISNPKAQELLQLPMPELNTPFDIYFQQIQIIRMIDQVLEESHPVKEKITVHRPNAKEHTFEVTVVPYERRPGDSKQATLVIIYDITQIQQLETIRQEFIANASHELKTPVTSIKGFSETLLETGIRNPKEAERFLKIIYDESERLEHLVEAILDLSRADNQATRLHMTTFSIDEVFHTMDQLFLQKVIAMEVGLSFELDADENSIMMRSDRHRLEQILTNLIDNAINYSTPGSQVLVQVQQKNEDVLFIIKDEGEGIPAADLPRIFERFYRVDKGRSRESGGTGLGLSIVRNLVKLLGGNIEIKSRIHQGTTVFVQLPRELFY